MGMPARRIDADPFRASRASARRAPVAEAAPARTSAPARTKAASRASRPDDRAALRAAEKRARSVFIAFCVALAVASAIGAVRIALCVRATEMAISETRLRGSIKAARFAGEQLEADHSSLSTPSRIANIAEATMGMSRPRSVRYLTVGGTPAATATPAPAPASADVSGIGGLVEAVLQLSAGEADSLLVGELGLAGAR